MGPASKVTCNGSATCDVTCSAGTCDVTCADSAKCTCTGGTCNVTCGTATRSCPDGKVVCNTNC